MLSNYWQRLIGAVCGLAVATVGATAQAEAAPPVYTEAPTFYDWLPNAFTDVPHVFVTADPREHWKTYLWLTALTGVLVHYDQKILDGSQYYARDWGLISEHDSGTRSRLVTTHKVAGIDADLRLPAGANSSMYFIGDGLTSLAIVTGLAAYGGMTSDLRALNTASQVMETVALTGMFVISAKYTFGRQSPNQATESGGAWHPMPGPKNYLTHISSYDAFPSGHVATVTSVVTVIHDNYPEKAWILPVGYGAIGLLGFAMMNNGVHWAGDYPYGAAIGYVTATTVFERRKPKAPLSETARRETGPSFELEPYASDDGVGLAVAFHAPKYGF